MIADGGDGGSTVPTMGLEMGRPRCMRSCMSHRIHGTGISTYIWMISMVNVGKYTIHGSYGCIYGCFRK